MIVAVTIPCRNEQLYIAECIEAVYKADLPENCELFVYIVDGMSDDGTRELIQSLIQDYPNLFLVDNERQLTPFAFNLGIKKSLDADFQQIIGARHIISSNYLMNCIERIQADSSIWCVGGKIINEYVNPIGKVIALAMSTTFGMGLGNFRTLHKSGFTDTVTSPMYPKFVFEKIGYFDENLIRNQDDDFNFRVTQAGGKIFYDNDISLKYYVRGNFKGLWKQFFQYGYWKVFVNKKHRAVTTLRQLVPPLFVFYLVLALIGLLVSNNLLYNISILAPIFLYAVIALYFTIKALKTQTGTSFFQVLKTFPILHVGYGLGYLKGILHFLILGKKPSEKEKTLSR
jgi:glycosyltransferase involved in cell wall biosynthesis